MTKAIQFKNIYYRYPRTKKTVIKDLSFNVDKGEILAVMGENGAGKSTLCQILNGIIPHSAGGRIKGQVLIEGHDTSTMKVSELSTKVGIVLEDPETQLFTTSVLNEVAFGPENLGIPVDDILERVKWALDIVRLTGYEKRAPTELSGGQKQRLAIAAALVMRPSILILDEATSQIDPLGVTEVLSLVKTLNEEYGMTIVMATDKSEEVAKIADRILVLDQGEKIAMGSPREVFSNSALFGKFMIRLPQVSQLGVELQTGNHPLPVFPILLEEAQHEVVQLIGNNTGSVNLEQSGSNGDQRENAAANNHTAISVQNLSYSYGAEDVLAVDDVSFEIKKGEFVAIIGQNGSGKTTILKNLLALLHPEKSGMVNVAGFDTKDAAVADLARTVGFVLQNPDQQLFAETIEQEVAFGPQNLGLDEKEVKRRVNEAIELVDLNIDRNEFPPALSKGDRAKVVIASALALKPEIIILDEPTTGQDFKGCHQILQIARKLHQEGHTVVIVTHHMALVTEYAERVIVLRKGKIILDGNTQETFEQTELIREAHIIPPQIIELGQQLPGYLGLPRTPVSVDQMSKAILNRLL